MKFIWILFILLALAGCEDSTKIITASTPEQTASDFFSAFYNEKDLEKAKQLSTDELAEIIDSYGTVRQAGRVLLGMTFDSVELVTKSSSLNLRETSSGDKTVSVIITGYRNGEKYNELRTIIVTKKQNRWVVKSINADRFNTTRV